MSQLAVYSGLLLLYIITSGITAGYFLNLLRQTHGRPKEYFGVLSHENLRWLPLIFSLVPAAADIMGYGISANVLTAGYLLVIAALYAPRPGRSPSRWNKKEKRFLLIWMAGWVMTGVLGAVITGFHRQPVVAVLCALFVMQPVAAPVMMYAMRPIERIAGRRYIRGSQGIRSLRRDMKVIVLSGNMEEKVLSGVLQKILSKEYRCELASRTVTSAMEAAQVIRDIQDPELEFFLCQVDADSRKELTAIVKDLNPKITVRVSADYYSLLDETLPAGGYGICFVNGDDVVLRQYIGTEEVVTYGLRDENDFRGMIRSVDGSGTAFVIRFSDARSIELNTRLLGEDRINALIGAVCVSYALGISEENIRAGIADAEPLPRHMELTAVPGAVMIDDSANEEELEGEAALETLHRFAGMKILITEGFLRQGAIQEEANRRFGARAAQICDRIILVGSDVAFGLKSGILESGFLPDRLMEATDRGDAVAMADRIQADGPKTILLESLTYLVPH